MIEDKFHRRVNNVVDRLIHSNSNDTSSKDTNTPQIRAFLFQRRERNFSRSTSNQFESKASASARVPVVGLCAFSRIIPEI